MYDKNCYLHTKQIKLQQINKNMENYVFNVYLLDFFYNFHLGIYFLLFYFIYCIFCFFTVKKIY